MASGIRIILKDNSHKGVVAFEAAIRTAGDWRKFWQGKRGNISQLWAKSRQEMFMTEGASTGSPWPKYTRQEQRYWLPIKRWSLGVRRLDPGSILRWTANPSSASAAPHERLYPSLCMVNDPDYIYKVSGNVVTLGTNVPYAINHDRGIGYYERRTSRKKSGSVIIPTPKRPLLLFGPNFTEDLRRQLIATAAVSGKGTKIGLTTSTVVDRFNMAAANGGGINMQGGQP